MVLKRVAPYGDWESPISRELATTSARGLSCPRVSANGSRAFYTEAANGRTTIMEIRGAGPEGVRDVVPDGYSVGTKIYEYGGSPFCVLSDGDIVFSNLKDNSVNLLGLGSGEVTQLVLDPALRFGEFDPHPLDSSLVFAVEEDHTEGDPMRVRNYVSLINACSGKVTRVAEGWDFYYTPIWSPDGRGMAYLCWDHPDLPFTNPVLCTRPCRDGEVGEEEFVVGGDGTGVAEPRWGPDGSLYYCRVVDGYRRLFRIPPGKGASAARHLEVGAAPDCEFGEISLLQGSHTYAPLSDQLVIATKVHYGEGTLVSISLDSDLSTDLPHNLNEIKFNAMTPLSESSVLVVATGPTTPTALYEINVGSEPYTKLIRNSIDLSLPRGTFAEPELVTLAPPEDRRGGSAKLCGYLWRPHNGKFVAPEGELPPLIMMCHGGPTGYTSPGLQLRTQYFVNRGYACLVLNYTGSAGHGEAYMNGLWENWGVVDAEDAALFASWCVEKQICRPGGVGITGGSAGGYLTLQALVRHPQAFASGVCVSGVSDLKNLRDKTHKLEARYVDWLVFKDGMNDEEKEVVMRERSPVYYSGRIEAPLLLLHGTADPVVPVGQARRVREGIARKGGVVKMIEYEGEGHMMDRTSQLSLLEEEEKWWRMTLLSTE